MVRFLNNWPPLFTIIMFPILVTIRYAGAARKPTEALGVVYASYTSYFPGPLLTFHAADRSFISLRPELDGFYETWYGILTRKRSK